MLLAATTPPTPKRAKRDNRKPALPILARFALNLLISNLLPSLGLSLLEYN